MLFNNYYEPEVCLICGSSNLKYNAFRRADQEQIVHCNACNTGFLQHFPKDQKDVFSIYSDHYFTSEVDNVGIKNYQAEFDADPGRGSYFSYLADKIKKAVDQKATVLEIGCNYGFLLHELEKRKINCEGLEMDREAYQACKSKGFQVYNSSLEEFNNSKKYDLIFAGMVIEHVFDPNDFITLCHNMLKPGGILFLTTPNFNMYKTYDNDWYGFKTSFEHLFYLSHTSFKTMYRNKFSIVESYTDCHLAKPALFLFDKVKEQNLAGSVARSIFSKGIRKVQATVFSKLLKGHSLFVIAKKQ